MKNDYYIIQSGNLNRKQNIIYFENENTKRPLPIEKIYSIYAYGRLTISSGAVDYLCKNRVPIHFFNYYGFYEGTLYPRETLISGDALVHQVEHFIDNDKRMELSKAFVKGASGNIMKNLAYYSRSKEELKDPLEKIETEVEKIGEQGNVKKLMNVEGRIRDLYYRAIDLMMPDEYKMIKRTRRPPGNKMNTLISFGNSLVYTTVLTEIYNTHLNPAISYLHEPYERRFSLSLDIAEIFKPIIADRIIFKLVNKKMLDDDCFRGEIGDIALTEKGKKIFLKEYNEKLATTIKHKKLGRNISYQRLIRLECYKIEKHLMGGKKYRPLIMWW